MEKRINDITNGIIDGPCLPLNGCPVRLNAKNRLNILALGDVGTTMLIGLKLLGSDVIDRIGICDIRKDNTERLEIEMNQIGYPTDEAGLPEVVIVGEADLFDCDVMIFCASRGVPPVNEKAAELDVRMVQLEANREIIDHYAALAKKAAYRGLVCIVSDPVDNLAAAFLDASGLKPWQIQGYGLGVMHRRALYYAKRAGAGQDPDTAIADYAGEGRAFGPHGEDLVIANSLTGYDDRASRELTRLTVEANLRVRDLGYKPYIAPALSSAALSILMTLRGQWHYGSLYFGDERSGAFLGLYNRLTEDGWEYEDTPLPEALFDRILNAYRHLCAQRNSGGTGGE